MIKAVRGVSIVPLAYAVFCHSRHPAVEKRVSRSQLCTDTHVATPQLRYNEHAMATLWRKLVIALFFLPGIVFAQAPASKNTPTQVAPITIATVNIQNAKIISQEGNTLNISFDLTNREGMQSGVRYAVALVATTTEGQFLADEKVYPDTLTLAEHSSTPVDITYTAPEALSGTFTVLLSSSNDSGLPLALHPIGKVTLAPTGGIEIVSSSCYLTVVGEKGSSHYTLIQGVDIA